MRRGVLRWVRVCYRFSTRSRGGCGQPCTSGWPWPCWCRSAPWVRIDGGARRRLRGRRLPCPATPPPCLCPITARICRRPSPSSPTNCASIRTMPKVGLCSGAPTRRPGIMPKPETPSATLSKRRRRYDLAREYAAAETPDESAHNGAAEMNAVTASDVPQGAGATANTAHIVVNVALDPKLKDSVGPNDTLFVFAKAAHGPPDAARHHASHSGSTAGPFDLD